MEKLTRQGVRDLNKLGPKQVGISRGSYDDQLCRRGLHVTSGQKYVNAPANDARRYAGVLVKYCANCGKEADSFCPRYAFDVDRY